MILRNFVIPVLLALALTACERSTTATVQIHSKTGIAEPSSLFLSSQVAILSTQNTIQSASKASEIDSKIISNAIKISRITGTDLVTISAHHKDQAISKKIVLSLIEAYVTTRTAQEKQQADKATEALDEQLQQQGDLVHDKQKALTVLIQQYGIPNCFTEPISDNLTEVERYEQAREELNQLRLRKKQLEIQIQELANDDPLERIRAAAGFDIPDNRVAFYYHAYRDTMDTIEEEKAIGTSPKTAILKRLLTRANLQQENAKKAVSDLTTNLRMQLSLITQEIDQMCETIIEKKSQAVDLSVRQHDYNTAKEEYEQSRSLLHEMKLQQQEARVLLHMPHTPITIHGWTQD